MNLAANDTIKIIKIIKDALGIAYEIIKLIKNSPKRTGNKQSVCISSIVLNNYSNLYSIAILERIKEEYLDTSVGIRNFCSTRWTLKHQALWALIVNFKFLIEGAYYIATILYEPK